MESTTKNSLKTKKATAKLETKIPFPQLFARLRAQNETLPIEWQERLASCLRDMEAAYAQRDQDALLTAAETYRDMAQEFVSDSHAYLAEIKARNATA